MQIFSVEIDDAAAIEIAEAFAAQYNFIMPPDPYTNAPYPPTVDASPPWSDSTPGYSTTDATPLDPALLAKMEFARQKVIDYITEVITTYKLNLAITEAKAEVKALLSSLTIV